MDAEQGHSLSHNVSRNCCLWRLGFCLEDVGESKSAPSSPTAAALTFLFCPTTNVPVFVSFWSPQTPNCDSGWSHLWVSWRFLQLEGSLFLFRVPFYLFGTEIKPKTLLFNLFVTNMSLLNHSSQSDSSDHRFDSSCCRLKSSWSNNIWFNRMCVWYRMKRTNMRH